jgi:hypothetical protein
MCTLGDGIPWKITLSGHKFLSKETEICKQISVIHLHQLIVFAGTVICMETNEACNENLCVVVPQSDELLNIVIY